MMLSSFGTFLTLNSIYNLVFRHDAYDFMRFSWFYTSGPNPERRIQYLAEVGMSGLVVMLTIGICFLVDIFHPERFFGPKITPSDVYFCVTMFQIGGIIDGLWHLYRYKRSAEVAVEFGDRLFGRELNAKHYRSIALGLALTSLSTGILGLLGLIPMRI